MSSTSHFGRAMERVKQILPLVNLIAAVAMTVASVLLIWRYFGGTPPPPPSTRSPFSLEGSASRGEVKAALILVEFSEYQCPDCAAFERDVFPNIEERYIKTGKLRFVYRHLALSNQADRVRAVKAAECASREGQFWPMHKTLIAAPTLDESEVMRAAATVGLNAEAFAGCLSGSFDVIERGLEDGRRMGLKTTPSFIFGHLNPEGLFKPRGAIGGKSTAKAFQKLIDSLLQ